MDLKRMKVNEDDAVPSTSSDNVADKVIKEFTTSEYCLTHVPIIVESIFALLNAKQLCTVAAVCKFWNELADKEKLKRIGIETKMVYVEDEDEDWTDDSKKMMSEIQDALIHKIKTARCYPAVAILYINRSERFYGVLEEMAAVRKMLKRVYKVLPPSCELIGALAGGVIGCCDHLQVEEVEQTESASLLLLPKSLSLKLHTFFLTMTDIRAAGRSASKWEEMIGCPKSLSPKLALIHACCDTNEVQDAVAMLSELYGDQLPVAGGIAEHLVDNNRLKSKGISGILLDGNIAVDLKVSIGPDISDLSRNLKDMKCKNCTLSNSLMLMYSCVARGQQLYEQPNAETTCVREIYGKIPVFGFFAFGEIGKVGSHSQENDRRASKQGSTVHSFSTVSCYCHFG